MAVASATDLNKHPGLLLQKALKEPVIINKMGRPTIVMLSYEHFEELEDALWGLAAKKREQKGEWISHEETIKFLKNV